MVQQSSTRQAMPGLPALPSPSDHHAKLSCTPRVPRKPRPNVMIRCQQDVRGAIRRVTSPAERKRRRIFVAVGTRRKNIKNCLAERKAEASLALTVGIRRVPLLGRRMAQPAMSNLISHEENEVVHRVLGNRRTVSA